MPLNKNGWFFDDEEDWVPDDDIGFWSKIFDERVFRMMTTGEIQEDIGEKFLAVKGGFKTQILSSDNGFLPKDVRPEKAFYH